MNWPLLHRIPVVQHGLLAAALVVAICGLFLGAKILQKYLSLDFEISRKVVHVVCALTGAVLVAWVPDRPTLILAATGSGIALAAMRYIGLLGHLTRPNRSFRGPIAGFAAFSILLLIGARDANIQIALCVLAFADTAACLAGRRWGYRTLTAKSAKTWIGTFAFAVSAFAVLFFGELFLAGASLGRALAVAAIAACISAAVEGLATGDADNLLIPVSVALTLHLAENAWAGSLVDPIVQLAIVLAVAGLAIRRRWLSADGALSVVIVGIVLFATVGYSGTAVMTIFFLAGSIATRVRPETATQHDAREGRRAGQVWAWALMPVTAGLLFALAGHSPHFAAAFVGSVAVAASDTMATEVGRFSSTEPRLIVSLAKVPPGTSGGVTPAGIAGAAFGALLIAAAGAGVRMIEWSQLLPVATIAFLGSFVDSLLGATLQRGYIYEPGGYIYEDRLKDVHISPVLVRGLAYVSNETVNFLTAALVFCVCWLA
ncbi:MAG: DUF92 domain-containing protein [Rhizomicrobium sp.]